MKRGLLLSLLLCSLAWGQWQLPPYQKPMLGAMLDYSDPINRGLVGCWLMNEGCGNQVRDASGNGLNGTIFGCTWSATSQGTAIVNPISTHRHASLSVPSSPLLYGSGNFTILVGYQPFTQDGYGPVFSKGTSSADEYALYFSSVSPQVLTFKSDNGAGTNSSTATVISSNSFIHFAVVRNGASCRIYQNGVDTTATAGTHTTIVTASNSYVLGAYDSLESYTAHGEYYYSMFFRRALSPSEILRLYRDPWCGMARDPIDLWYAGLADALVGSIPIFIMQPIYIGAN
jgi:hypothetical protein